MTTDESKTPDLDALARETIALGKRATQGPDGPECVKCGGYMTIQYGDEPTVLCHNCAHQVAETDAPALAQALLEAREAMREVLTYLADTAANAREAEHVRRAPSTASNPPSAPARGREVAMDRRQARRLALVTISNELRGSLDTSDEWVRHAETDAVYTKHDARLVREEAEFYLRVLNDRIGRLNGPHYDDPAAARKEWTVHEVREDAPPIALMQHQDEEANAALIAAYRTTAPALVAKALLETREAMRKARSAAAGRNPRKAMAILDRALRSGAGQGEGGGG